MIAIGDIAGNFKTLKALVDKLPNKKIILLGDPNDRGPRSNEVIQFIIDNQDRFTLVNSNHAHMMVDHYECTRFYDRGTFLMNGGTATMRSYENMQFTPSHIEFLKSSPNHILTDKYLFSHAPLHSQRELKDIDNLGKNVYDYHFDSSIIWNRQVPNKPHSDLNGRINIFGHNGAEAVKLYCKQYPNGWYIDQDKLTNYLKEFGTGDIWGICLDTCWSNVLTALDLDTMTLYTQEYID